MSFINKRRHWAVIIVGMIGIMIIVGSVGVSPTLASSECETFTVSRAEIGSVKAETRDQAWSLLTRPYRRVRLEPDPDDDNVTVEVCPMTDDELTAFLDKEAPYFLLQILNEGITSDLRIWVWEKDI